MFVIFLCKRKLGEKDTSYVILQVIMVSAIQSRYLVIAIFLNVLKLLAELLRFTKKLEAWN